MADSEDLKLLMSGEIDLSRCDFRGANLKGMDLRGRDFSHSLLEKAECEGTQFGDCNFEGAKFRFMQAPNAVFDGCILKSIHFGFVNLTGASLRNADATNAVFQNVKLANANLSSANLSNGQMDADTSLDGVITNNETRFDSLKVLRPTSRNPIFKDYTFEKGKLVRKATNREDKTLVLSEERALNALSGVRNETALKRNHVDPPIFLKSTGEIEIDYTNHDGRAIIGEGQTKFTTQWSTGSSSSITAYNDPSDIRGIAVASAATSSDDVAMSSIAGLDFSSRSRLLSKGQVIVFENIFGRFLAVQVVDISAVSHGDDENRLVLRYAIVPTDQASEQLAEIVSIAQAVEADLKRFRTETETAEPLHGGIGHNNPPDPTPLTTVELDAAILAVREVRQAAEKDAIESQKLEESKNTIAEISKKIAAWVGRKCDLAVDEFAKQAGKTLADGKFIAASWLAVSGRLDQLIASLAAFM
jgi:hypothetical protein